MAVKALKTGQPPYLAQQLCAYAPTRALRSSTSKLLEVPRTTSGLAHALFCICSHFLELTASQRSFL